MKSLPVIFFILTLGLLVGCATTSNNLPTSDKLYADMKPSEIFVWVGKGKAFVFENGSWIRKKESDYDFSVVQRRFREHWLSVKNQIRLHPEYDQSAGPRSQTHIFKINYNKKDSLKLSFKLDSTFGSGVGSIDKKFSKGIMTFKAQNISSFAPYSHFRITQSYDYKNKTLTETVFLFKLDAGKEIPFAKIEEVAKLSSIK